MLEVKPIGTKDEQERVCRACGMTYDADALAYSVREGDTLLGCAQFTPGVGATLLGLRSAAGTDDADALFIAGRAVLNFLDLSGVKTAYCADGACEEALSARVGFTRGADGRLAVSLEDFFKAPCKHHPM